MTTRCTTVPARSLHRRHRRAVAVVTLAACGGGGNGNTASAGAARDDAGRGDHDAGDRHGPRWGDRPSTPQGNGRFGGGQFAAMAQQFTQCLRDQGLEVGDLTARPNGNGGGQGGGEGGPPADGSRPRFDGSRPSFEGQPPADGSRPTGGEGQRPQVDPAQMAQRFAQRLGLDTTNEAVAAAVTACSAQLG